MRKRANKPRAGGEMSEARFWSFIRSGLRQMSQRWPPTARLIWVANRRQYSGPNKRQKWEFLCAGCGHWFMRKEMHADHIIECGKLSSLEQVGECCERLLCEVESLRILGEECHAERHRRIELTTEKQP